MNYAIILAGGIGSRAGGSLPKQFQEVKGKKMIWWSVEAFRNFDPACRLILVVHPYYLEKWEEMFGKEEGNRGYKIHKVAGGDSRIASVRNGLEKVKELISENEKESEWEDNKVFIHDSARPNVSISLIKNGSEIVKPGVGAIPTVPLADSIRKIEPESTISVPRSCYVAVQTPQIFLFNDIYKAYCDIKNEADFTDDASVAENSGMTIVTFPGDPENFKVTNPSDFKRL